MEPENFNPMQLAQDLTDQLQDRLFIDGPPEALEENTNLLANLNQIAVEQLLQEAGIEVPAANGVQLIPLDEKLLSQALTLFAEGIYHALIKCGELGLRGELKRHLIESLALNVYQQAKQVVAATYGQEHTPEFQFTMEQQIGMLTSAAESALMYHLGEYEKDRDPEAQPAPLPAYESPPVTLDDSGEAYQKEVVDAEQQMAQVPALSSPVKPTGPSKHDKYAAVALLLTTVQPQQRAGILRNFNDEEKELITYYSYPQHIEDSLDLAYVESHLRKFKEVLGQGDASLRSPASQGLAELARGIPREKLLSYVKDERPRVKQYLAALYGPAAESDEYSDAGTHPAIPAQRQRYFSEVLPPRIEEALFRFLSKQSQAAS